MIRAFIAVHPHPELIQGILARRRPLEATAVPVKWVEPQNLHFTLKFLGYVAPERAQTVGAALQRVAAGHPAFDLEMGGIGAFPSASRPRVIWVGTAGGSDRLRLLQQDVESRLHEMGLEKEERPFTAHLTLGRIKFPRSDARLRQLLESQPRDPIGTLRIHTVSLMQSVLGPQGPTYSHLLDCPLA